MAYLGKSPSQGVRNRYYFTASGGETSISGALTGGTLTFTDGNYVDVNLNGVTLVAGTDYNTSTANTIAGLSALTASDVVEIVVYDVFSVFSGNVNSDFSVGGNLSVTGTSTLTGVSTFTAGFTASDGCTITTADNTDQLTLKSTDADASVGPVLRMNRDSGSPADNDVTGGIIFNADDGAGNSTEFVSILTQSQTVANGSEDGRFQMSAMKAGTARNRFDITNAETVFNEDSVDVDFRVESLGDPNSFVVEGATRGIGMGTADPTIDSSLAGVSVSVASRVLHIHDDNGAYLKLSDPASGSNRGAQVALIGTDAILNNCESGNLIFGTGNTERGRINSAGALLIGKNADSISNNGISAAGSATGGGHLSVTNDGNSCVTLNRKSSDGTIMSFATDGSTGGSIGVLSDRLCVGQSDVGLFFDATNNTITPFSFDTFDTIDNHIDLGIGSRRFQDIFASNGTIQTSDENEKQNIASLTSTEITAAKAISALFKTYKWKDAAASKGDAARTHTGVIAQEVQAAMSDAGLDAANYAFWCYDTWWETSTDVPAVEAVEAADAVYDDDGNEVSAAVMPVEAKDAYTRIDTYHTADEAPDGATQRTRMGIRYPELLAFIGAATEQRLTDIETRLTALETE